MPWSFAGALQTAKEAILDFPFVFHFVMLLLEDVKLAVLTENTDQ